MQPETLLVGMAEVKVTKAPDRISCLGLGSCIGVCAYYAPLKIGGIAHIMLPSSLMARDEPANPGKFADTAIPLLLDQLEKYGGKPGLAAIKIVGGAQMFSVTCPDERLNIGYRNITAVEEVCDKMGLKIAAKVVGGTCGRSVLMNLDTGIIQVRTLAESVFI